MGGSITFTVLSEESKPLLFGLVDQIDGPKVIGHIDRPVGLLAGGEFLFKAIIADEHFVLVLRHGARSK